ncbi:MAG: signal peptidase I [Clostridiales bacterium]|nr:signal peptidase I [Clostridiales bacterium]
MSEAKKRRRTEGRARTYRNAKRMGWLFSVLVTIAVLCLVFFVWLFPTRISDDSMAPALNSGEVVLCDRFGKFLRMPERGDIVLFQTGDGLFVKRIVGMPGETVEIVEGRVFIDSIPLDESSYAVDYVGDMAPLDVPAGSVFVLGDNRAEMYDSRLASVGCIPFARIEGMLRLRVSPFDRITYFS